MFKQILKFKNLFLCKGTFIYYVLNVLNNLGGALVSQKLMFVYMGGWGVDEKITDYVEMGRDLQIFY